MNKNELKEKLKSLYNLYQFRMEQESENMLVFTYYAGYFRNVEIVLLKNNAACQKEADRIEQEYREIQYNNIVKNYYEDFEEAHDRLFKAFFFLKESHNRLRFEYKGFCDQKSAKLLDKYAYIPCHYRDGRGKEHEDLAGKVVKSAEGTRPVLVILEAAAGYGKTCTAYEILASFLKCQPEKIPLFIELSKNRTARVFRHVLNDEIDKKFTQLSFNAVMWEIKNGKIPLIIDGFDELIEQKGKDSEEEINEQSLTLLSTITELLGDGSQAWVLLTTRRSAIFTGDIFNEWAIANLGSECSIERLQIQMPSINEWITSEKYELMQKYDVDLEKLANPVLLTFIRNMELHEFNIMIQNEDRILDQYFSLLFSRELTRQNLEFTEREFHTVMKRLAAEFVRYDITADDIEFIQELLQEILQDDLLRYRSRYKEKYCSEEGMLSQDQYIKRISHNYLLDRISADSNKIGFVNEFILGILVGDAVRDGILKEDDISERERFIDMSATSFSVRGEGIREEYYAKLKECLTYVSDICRFNAEMCLLQKTGSNYKDAYFRGFYINHNFRFVLPYKFDGCTFDTCTFDGCEVQAEVFVDCIFVNCQFYDIRISGKPNWNLIFMGCDGYEQLVAEYKPVETSEKVDHYEKLVLEQFWKIGSERAELRRSYTALFKGIDTKEKVYVQDAIKSLLKKGLIRELSICYELNTVYIGEIMHILGRR